MEILNYVAIACTFVYVIVLKYNFIRVEGCRSGRMTGGEIYGPHVVRFVAFAGDRF